MEHCPLSKSLCRSILPGMESGQLCGLVPYQHSGIGHASSSTCVPNRVFISSQALPFTTILLIMLVWLLVGFPLNVLGGIMGKNMASGFDAPCRTKNIAREIPPSPWYRSMVVHMAIGGFLPFRSVSLPFSPCCHTHTPSLPPSLSLSLSVRYQWSCTTYLPQSGVERHTLSMAFCSLSS